MGFVLRGLSAAEPTAKGATCVAFALSHRAATVLRSAFLEGDMGTSFLHTLSGGRVGFPALLDALEAHLSGAGVTPAVMSSVMIATDEVVANVLDYSGASSVQVAAQVHDGVVGIQVSDDGAPFDPTGGAAPDTTLSVEARGVGGLGIHLIQKLMDRVAYERVGGMNRLSFSKSYDLVSNSKA